MAGDFQLIHVTVDEERLKAASVRRRNQFVGCMHAHNELAFLNRMLLFVVNDTGNGELHDAAQSVQFRSVLQLLAAKLFETWAMIKERFLRSNPPDLVSRLEAPHQESLQWLSDYFGRNTSAIKIIRDKTAFHYDQLNLTEAADNLATGEESLYLAQHPANSLYPMGSALVFRAIFAMIADNSDGATVGTHEDRVIRGASIAQEDAMTANTHLHNVLYGLIRLLMDDLGVLAKSAQQVRINVSDVPTPARVGIPAFIDIGPGRTATGSKEKG
jgi:hypothetical protein